MKTLSLLLLLVACVALPTVAKDKDKPKDNPKKDAPPAAPAERGDKHDKPGDKHGDKHDKHGGDRSFKASEREIIIAYTKQHGGDAKGKKGKDLPPGLAKKVARGGKLPPGWEAKVVRGQILAVEVFEQAHPLPRELTVKLPAPPVGTITIAIDGRLVRLLEATREILDVFEILP